eukprot:TRINITY_DN15573_c0_g1_i1.p1 TRINITY_DN15573_c0_g1~~TRINITY_DN15573_c0_g1_i1.p1  ORF type:complete len:210 (+),score=38.76 TRINITY_DN15573_c0_g1_i1:46-675(+)
MADELQIPVHYTRSKAEGLPSQAVLDVREATLPEKSAAAYKKYFSQYKEWCEKHQCWEQTETEDVLILYFSELVKQYKISTCWTRASAIKSLLFVEGHKKALPDTVVALLKAKGRSQKAKKSMAFSKEEMERYLKLEVLTNENLVEKLAFAIGILGALRGQENTNLMWNNFHVTEDQIVCTFTRLKKSAAQESQTSNSLVEKDTDLCQK